MTASAAGPAAAPGPGSAAVPVRTAWGLRVLVAVMVVVSGVVHVQVWAQYMHSVALVGPGFLALGVVGIALGIVVVIWRHRLPLLAAVVFGAGSLLALGVALTPVGLLGVHSQLSGWAEWTSVLTEAAAVVLALAALRIERRPA